MQHAFAFPAAKRVVYSTCSIHAEENENVVVRALQSPIARARGWRVLKRGEQVAGMKKWHVRGDLEGIERILHEDGGGEREDAQTIADACIRCEKGTADGTMGFFVVGFVRDGVEVEGIAAKKAVPGHEDEELVMDDEGEWSGFDDGD